MSRFVSRVLAVAFAFATGSAAAQQTLTVWFTKAFYPAEDAALQDVIKKFDAQPFQGRNLAVSEARAREDRPPGPRPGGFDPRASG